MSSYGMLNTFGAILVGIVVVIWLVALQLLKADPNYFQTPDGLLHWWSPRSISQVVRMIFDTSLPRSEYRRGVCIGIYVARILYALGIAGLVVFFYVIFKHPALIVMNKGVLK